MKKKILIVDDDPRNIFALEATLKAKGFDCISRFNAQEALDVFENQSDVAAVLLDMMMPDMDGYEAIPLFKQLNPKNDVPIIAVTAQAMVGDKEKCLAAGADNYVSKPIDVDRLMQILITL